MIGAHEGAVVAQLVVVVVIGAHELVTVAVIGPVVAVIGPVVVLRTRGRGSGRSSWW